MILEQLIYQSEPTIDPTSKDLVKILRSARKRNARLQVSGALLYSGAYFVQVLEGSCDAINKVYDRLMRDPRHHTLRLISYRRIQARRFEDWRMAMIPPDQLYPEFVGKLGHDSAFMPRLLGPDALVDLIDLLLERAPSTEPEAIDVPSAEDQPEHSPA